MADNSQWMQSTVTLIVLGAMIPTYGNIRCDTARLLMHTLLSILPSESGKPIQLCVIDHTSLSQTSCKFAGYSFRGYMKDGFRKIK